MGNRNLKHELFVEFEAGIEAKFWDNRIGLDLSVYQKESQDLIINLPLDPSTGYTSTGVNAANIDNKGIELGLNISPPLPGGVRWDINLNYTKNVREVTEIFEGIDRVRVAGFNTLGNYAIPGEPFNVFYGEAFRRAEEGQFEGQFVVGSDGAYQGSGELSVIGDPNPDFRANWINDFSWKGVSFGFHFQWIQGGDIQSSTIQAILARGNTIDTDVDRGVPIIMPNSVKQTGVESDGTPIYVPNDIQTYMGDTFFRAYFFADEGGVFDATVVRLRQVSLSYVLPKSILENTPFGTAALTISGENLWYSAPNFPDGTNFDPEISSLGVGNGLGFDFRTAPTAKKYGINLALTF